MNLEKLTRKELYRLACEKKLKGRSSMKKDELVEALSPFFTKTTVEETVSSPSAPMEKATKKTPPLPEEYHIPDRYQMDTIVLLPINPEKEYVYWEVSDKTVDTFCSEKSITDPVIMLKLFANNSGKESELASVRVGRYGNWFFEFEASEQMLWAEIGMLDKTGAYHKLLTSRQIKMPSNKVSSVTDEETWMTVGEKIEEIIKLSGSEELQKQGNVESSARFHKDLIMMLEKNISSSNFQE